MDIFSSLQIDIHHVIRQDRMVFLSGAIIMRMAALAFTLALAIPTAWSATPCVDACKVLVDEGNAFSQQGKPQQAYDKYKAFIDRYGLQP
jgi:hypothetical protein